MSARSGKSKKHKRNLASSRLSLLIWRLRLTKSTNKQQLKRRGKVAADDSLLPVQSRTRHQHNKMDRNTIYIASLRKIPGNRRGAWFQCKLQWSEGKPYIMPADAIAGLDGVLFDVKPLATNFHLNNQLDYFKRMHFHWLQYESPLIRWINQWDPLMGSQKDHSFDLNFGATNRQIVKQIKKLPDTPINFDNGLAYLNHLQKQVTDEEIKTAELWAKREEAHRWEVRVSRLENELARLKSQGKKVAKQKTKFSKVYVMKDRQNGLYKIGKSKNPSLRERTLQSEKPSVEMVFSTNERNDFHERLLHAEFKEFRIRGEWFDLTPAQVRHICKRGAFS